MGSELRLACKFQMAEMEAEIGVLRARLEELERAMKSLAAHEAELEKSLAATRAAATAPGRAAAPAAETAPAPVAASVPEPAAPEIAEEIVLVISAAVAAFLGKRARIRQMRLVSSHAWAQQGRASVQASHGIVVQR